MFLGDKYFSYIKMNIKILIIKELTLLKCVHIKISLTM